MACIAEALQVVQIQRGNTEHFSRAFTVGTGDERGVDINKSSALEELVNCKSGGASSRKREERRRFVCT